MCVTVDRLQSYCSQNAKVLYLFSATHSHAHDQTTRCHKAGNCNKGAARKSMTSGLNILLTKCYVFQRHLKKLKDLHTCPPYPVVPVPNIDPTHPRIYSPHAISVLHSSLRSLPPYSEIVDCVRTYQFSYTILGQSVPRLYSGPGDPGIDV